MPKTSACVFYTGIFLLFSACSSSPESVWVVPVFDFAASDDSLEATSLLGAALYRTTITGERGVRLRDQLEEAQILLTGDPYSVDGFVWYGRRLAYLGRYRDAIEVYTKGLERFPEEPHLLRHRGHRFITTRRFDAAIGDFELAVEAVAGHADGRARRAAERGWCANEHSSNQHLVPPWTRVLPARRI